MSDKAKKVGELMAKIHQAVRDSGLDSFDAASVLDMVIADLMGKERELYKTFAAVDLIRYGKTPEQVADILK